MPYKINIIYQNITNYNVVNQLLKELNPQCNTDHTVNIMTNKGIIKLIIYVSETINLSYDPDIIIIPFDTNVIQSYQFIVDNWEHNITYNIPIIKIGINTNEYDLVSTIFPETHSFYKLSTNNNNHFLQTIIWKLCGYNCIISPTNM